MNWMRASAAASWLNSLMVGLRRGRARLQHFHAVDHGPQRSDQGVADAAGPKAENSISVMAELNAAPLVAIG